MKRILAIPLVLGSLILGSAAVAQDTGTLSEICDSGAATGNSYQGAALAPFIEGQWSQIADGMGYTTGRHVNPFTVTYDRVSQGFFVAAEGARIRLRPINSFPGNPNLNRGHMWDEAVSYTPEGGDTVSFKLEDLLLLSGCDFDETAAFWWQFGAGANTSTGFMVFVTPEFGYGVSRNSAMGMRRVMLLR